MLTYTYIAVERASGKKIKADIEAANEAAAAKILSDKGLSPLEIDVKKEGKGLLGRRGRVHTKEKVIFSRQLSTLINAGLPLVQSLTTVSGQTGNKNLKAAIDMVVTDVEGGSNLSDALAKHPQIFGDLYVSIVAAGETSGTLDKSLESLADQQEKDASTTSRIRGAMIYPLIVLFVLAAVMTFMLTTVLPQVKTLYEGLPGAQLPFLTRSLLTVSQALVHFWWIFILALGGGIFFLLKWSQTVNGRRFFDNFKMHGVLIGPLFMQLYMARFARVASTLVASGVPMIKMLNTTSRAVGNVHIAASIDKATEKVKGGVALSEALKGDPNFLELVPDMIHIGEQSGQLDGMLARLATYYEREVDNKVKNISTIIEPAMMVFIGVLALLVVAAVLLPIYSLAGKNLTGAH